MERPSKRQKLSIKETPEILSSNQPTLPRDAANGTAMGANAITAVAAPRQSQ
jgi:hypothetical protein